MAPKMRPQPTQQTGDDHVLLGFLEHLRKQAKARKRERAIGDEAIDALVAEYAAG